MPNSPSCGYMPRPPPLVEAQRQQASNQFSTMNQRASNTRNLRSSNSIDQGQSGGNKKLQTKKHKKKN
jgi:hypothetical protein